MFVLVTYAGDRAVAAGEYPTVDEAMQQSAAMHGERHWEPFGIREAGDGQPSYWLANSFTERMTQLCIIREPAKPTWGLLGARYRVLYGLLAEEYEAKAPGHSAAVEERAARLLRFTEGATALDPGCGTGQALAALDAHGLATTGCDLCPQMAAIARITSPRSRVVAGDFMLADLPPADIIWESALLHLYPASAQPAIFARFRELLTPGGLLSVSTTASAASSEGWERKLQYASALRRYRRHITEPELEAAFTTHRFRVVDVLRLADPMRRQWFAVTGVRL